MWVLRNNEIEQNPGSTRKQVKPEPSDRFDGICNNNNNLPSLANRLKELPLSSVKL